MRILSHRDLAVALLSIAGTCCALAAVDQKPAALGYAVFDWNSLPVRKTAVGESRSIVRAPTATLDQLEMHVTTLNPGQAPHPPHRHANEEIIIVDKGTVAAFGNGVWKTVGPGSVIFNASDSLHGIKNVGATPATYHVISFVTDKTLAIEKAAQP